MIIINNETSTNHYQLKIIKSIMMRHNRTKMIDTLIKIFLLSNIGNEIICISEPRKPNIVFILADDLGYNGIGYINPSIISPNIDSLAKSGIQLKQNYVQPVCTPSRAALLTGMYPYHIGRQSGIIKPTGNINITTV